MWCVLVTQLAKHACDTKSRKHLVEERKLPEGDVLTQMLTLQTAVMDRMRWARGCASSNCVIDNGIYLSFVGLLGAALYVFSPQGRISGIKDMKMSQVDSLFQDGWAESTTFKTSGTYGYQPVTVGVVSMELLRIYVDFVRPVAASTQVEKPTDFLFIKWKDNDVINLGRSITSFFKIHTELNMTTSTLRALVETFAESQYRDGLITLTERRAVESVNGHSSAVVEKHYLQLDRTADVFNSRTVIERLIPHLNNSVNHSPLSTAIEEIPTPLPLPSTWLVRDNLKHVDWGTQHPCYTKVKPAKVPWSKEEIDYIEHWSLLQPDDDMGKFASRCLEEIRKDPRAVPIFHKHHVFSASRMRNGLNALAARIEKLV